MEGVGVSGGAIESRCGCVMQRLQKKGGLGVSEGAVESRGAWVHVHASESAMEYKYGVEYLHAKRDVCSVKSVHCLYTIITV